MPRFETIKKSENSGKDKINPDDFLGGHWDEELKKSGSGNNIPEEEIVAELKNPLKEIDKIREKKRIGLRKKEEVVPFNPLKKVEEKDINDFVNDAFSKN